MQHKPRPASLRTLACALAALVAPVHTQELAPMAESQPELYVIEATVDDLISFAALVEAWADAPITVLDLDLGPSTGLGQTRQLRAHLYSPSLDAMYQPTLKVEGVQFTLVKPKPASATAPRKRRGSLRPDRETGRYELTFSDLDFGPEEGPSEPAPPKRLHRLNGKEATLEGYMIPLEWDGKDGVAEFILVPHLMQCCFGGSPALDEWILVTPPEDQPAPYVPLKPIRIEGRLVLPSLEVGESEEEFDVAYRMFEASVQPVLTEK